MRSTSSASVSADDTTRATRSSSSAGSGGVSRAARMFGDRERIDLRQIVDDDAPQPLQRDLHRIARAD
jgi:hypothetical protein